jgi:aminopeptidase N
VEYRPVRGRTGSTALNLDAQPTTRAIRANADTPDEIDQMFDGIAYGKASDVLLDRGELPGRRDLPPGRACNYLAAHVYANATAEDFWGAQTATSHKPVDKIMESLVAQPGAPILTFGEPLRARFWLIRSASFSAPGIQPDSAQKWTLPRLLQEPPARTASFSLPPTTF